ncbi:MAG: LamG domain-containing protein [Candidatus Aenigmarchaeota archaeon]|nr:LamG domain-containing protein [Candidatus Aenigmarchaeota archaeon]
MKAITPVISIIILLVIAIAIAGSAYLFIFGQFNARVENLFDIMHSGSYCRDGNVDIIIKNIGTTTLDLKNPGDEPPPQDSTNLVGLWHFDEGSGFTTTDSSGMGKDGTITNAEWIDDCVSGNCLDFNGNGYVSTDKWIDGIWNKFTWSSWVKERYRGGTYMIHRAAYADIISEANSGNTRFDTGYNPWRVSFNHYTGYDEWHHIAVTRNDENFSYYIDGERIDSDQNSGDTDWDRDYHGSYIGGDGHNGWAGYFRGAIDDVYIYTRGLGDDEVKQLFCNGAYGLLEEGIISKATYDSYNCDPGTGCSGSGRKVTCGDMIITKTSSGNFGSASFSKPSVAPGEIASLKDSCTERRCSYRIVSPAIGKDVTVRCG